MTFVAIGALRFIRPIGSATVQYGAISQLNEMH